MATPIILDCDPGHDDAIAILLAAASPAIDLLAITTVAGNQTLEKCTLNARRVCTIGGITDVPIAAGAERPLVRAQRVAANIHGESGLDGPTWPEPTVGVADESAVELMHRVLTEHAEPVTLVPVGPLTNIAMLLRFFPAVREKIAEVVLMGGSTGRGNVTPYGEFNVVADPEAADIVFRSGLPITMVGLNVSHQALVTAEIEQRLRALRNPVADVSVDLMTFFAKTYRAVHGMDAPPLHDPITVAHLIDPELLTCVEAPVTIETSGAHTAGATVVDLHGVTEALPNACVAVGIDADRFFGLVLEALGTYS